MRVVRNSTEIQREAKTLNVPTISERKKEQVMKYP
jgi:hypothetical protein